MKRSLLAMLAGSSLVLLSACNNATATVSTPVATEQAPHVAPPDVGPVIASLPLDSGQTRFGAVLTVGNAGRDFFFSVQTRSGVRAFSTGAEAGQCSDWQTQAFWRQLIAAGDPITWEDRGNDDIMCPHDIINLRGRVVE